jgi:hypothetical protein
MTGWPGDHRVGVGPSQGLHLLRQSLPDPPQRLLARLGQQLAPVTADLEPQEVHPLIKVGDAGLGLVEGQASGLQPPGELLLDVLGLLTGVTLGEHIIGLCRLPYYADRDVNMLVRALHQVARAA